MSAPTNGYTVKLVYYGRADLEKTRHHFDNEGNDNPTFSTIAPQISTQNIRLVAFSGNSEDATDYIGIYELIKNTEAPKSDLEGTKI